MKQKKMLTLTLSQLKQLYQQELPELYQLANETTNETDFKNNLDKFLSLHPQAESNTGKQIRLLINYDGRSIHELQQNKTCRCKPFHYSTDSLPEIWKTPTWPQIYSSTCSTCSKDLK